MCWLMFLYVFKNIILTLQKFHERITKAKKFMIHNIWCKNIFESDSLIRKHYELLYTKLEISNKTILSISLIIRFRRGFYRYLVRKVKKASIIITHKCICNVKNFIMSFRKQCLCTVLIFDLFFQLGKKKSK